MLLVQLLNLFLSDKCYHPLLLWVFASLIISEWAPLSHVLLLVCVNKVLSDGSFNWVASVGVTTHKSDIMFAIITSKL